MTEVITYAILGRFLSALPCIWLLILVIADVLFIARTLRRSTITIRFNVAIITTTIMIIITTSF